MARIAAKGPSITELHGRIARPAREHLYLAMLTYASKGDKEIAIILEALASTDEAKDRHLLTKDHGVFGWARERLKDVQRELQVIRKDKPTPPGASMLVQHRPEVARDLVKLIASMMPPDTSPAARKRAAKEIAQVVALRWAVPARLEVLGLPHEPTDEHWPRAFESRDRIENKVNALPLSAWSNDKRIAVAALVGLGLGPKTAANVISNAHTE